MNIKTLLENLQKTREHKDDGNIKSNWYAGNNAQRTGKKTRRLGNKREIGNHSDDNIIKIWQNTEKSPGDLRKLAVTQSLVKTISKHCCEKLSKE